MRLEDNRLMTREMEKKLVETLLLIFAVALGVGAAAAGFSLAATAAVRSAQELALPQYREITVSTRTTAEDFTAPAMVDENTDRISLTLAQLAAAEEVPDVTGGFIMNERNFRLGNPMAMMGRGGEAPPEGEASEAPPRDDRFVQMMAAVEEAAAELENEPQPLLEEMRGYQVTADFFVIREIYPASGSLFTQEDMEKARPLMAVGSELATTLFEDARALGRKIQVFNTIYTISAVLEPTGTELDNRAFVPIQASREMMVGGGGFQGPSSTLYFSVDRADHLTRAADQLEAWFSAEFGQGAVNIDIPRAEATEAADRNGRLITLILFLAVAGLLIASVNVSNILMGRAMRRQKAVGILKALGASRKRIFTLFFEEALIIGLLGSVLGVGLSLAMTSIMTRSMGLKAFSWGGITGGIILALSITLTLTLFPAVAASRTEAADAMRTE